MNCEPLQPAPPRRTLTGPKPNDGFSWVQVPAGHALVCNALVSLATHFFSTREWTLGSRHGTDAGSTDAAWEEVASTACVAPSRLLRAKQVHGVAVVVKRRGAIEPQPHADADILLTNESEVALAIQTADCVPLLIADRRTGAVAAAHAGWRGLAAGVPAVTVAALVREFGSVANDLMVVVGPSIGACCYEVGADVLGAFEAAGFSGAQRDRWFLRHPRATLGNPSIPGVGTDPRPDRWYLDLWEIARDQLEHAGIPRSHIHVAKLCTASHPDWFCSYRRDGAGAGRLAALIKKRP